MENSRRSKKMPDPRPEADRPDKNFDAAMRKILYYKQMKTPAKFTICTDNAGKVSVAKVEVDCIAP
jgi:hypothetical protein